MNLWPVEHFFPHFLTGLLCSIPVGNLRSMGQDDLIWSPLVSRILFRCLIFNCYNISICKKEKPKDETSKSVSQIFFRCSSLIVTTSAFIKKKRSKMRHLKKIVLPMEVKLRSKMSHWPKIPHRYAVQCTQSKKWGKKCSTSYKIHTLVCMYLV